jgi:hypothetical protein
LVESMPSKHKAVSSTPSTKKRKTKPGLTHSQANGSMEQESRIAHSHSSTYLTTAPQVTQSGMTPRFLYADHSGVLISFF